MNCSEKYKILLADDEPLNLKHLFEALASENYHIYTAPNGAVAYELAVRFKPDAIIMDWDMPIVNGIEATKMIRENADTQLIPIIMATGKMTSIENLETALSLGANDYIHKTYDTVEIIARVKSMIRLNKEYHKNIELQKKIVEYEVAMLKLNLETNTSALMSAKLRLIENGQSALQFVEDLEILRNYVSVPGNELINKIISHNKTSGLNVNWTEFETLFEKVHPAFFKHLQSECPDLSLSERKICAMIKLNLTTKEITAISNQGIEAVKKAKSRLKAKLNVDSMDSLYQFIQQIN